MSLEKQVLCRKEVFLSNPRNKQEFITALTAALIDAGYDVLRSDTDADRDIVVKARTDFHYFTWEGGGGGGVDKSWGV